MLSTDAKSPWLYHGSLGSFRWGVTSRHADGESDAPYNNFNLGLHVGDREDSVIANRTALAACIGVDRSDLRFMDQTHSANVRHVTKEPDPCRDTDALFTSDGSLALAVMVADCVPVVIVSDDGAMCGVAHAGRVGMQRGVLNNLIVQMRNAGATDLTAILGPRICGQCYEVDDQTHTEVARDVADAATTTQWSTPGIDLHAGLIAQLNRLETNYHQLHVCTVETPDLFSYRRSNLTGRFVAVVWQGDDNQNCDV